MKLRESWEKRVRDDNNLKREAWLSVSNRQKEKIRELTLRLAETTRAKNELELTVSSRVRSRTQGDDFYHKLFNSGRRGSTGSLRAFTGTWPRRGIDVADKKDNDEMKGFSLDQQMNETGWRELRSPVSQSVTLSATSPVSESKNTMKSETKRALHDQIVSVAQKVKSNPESERKSLRITIPGSNNDGENSSCTQMSAKSQVLLSPNVSNGRVPGELMPPSSNRSADIDDNEKVSDWRSEPAGTRTSTLRLPESVYSSDIESKVSPRNQETEVINIMVEVDREFSSEIQTLFEFFQNRIPGEMLLNNMSSNSLPEFAQNIESDDLVKISLPFMIKKDTQSPDGGVKDLMNIVSTLSKIPEDSPLRNIVLWDPVSRRPLMKTPVRKENLFNIRNRRLRLGSRSDWGVISRRDVFKMGFSILSISLVVWLCRNDRLTRIRNILLGGQPVSSSMITHLPASKTSNYSLPNLAGESLLFRY